LFETTCRNIGSTTISFGGKAFHLPGLTNWSYACPDAPTILTSAPQATLVAPAKDDGAPGHRRRVPDDRSRQVLRKWPCRL
jgi:hypothetical protein